MSNSNMVIDQKTFKIYIKKKKKTTQNKKKTKHFLCNKIYINKSFGGCAVEYQLHLNYTDKNIPVRRTLLVFGLLCTLYIKGDNRKKIRFGLCMKTIVNPFMPGVP